MDAQSVNQAKGNTLTEEVSFFVMKHHIIVSETSNLYIFIVYDMDGRRLFFLTLAVKALLLKINGIRMDCNYSSLPRTDCKLSMEKNLKFLSEFSK